jgi:hypothetical protein
VVGPSSMHVRRDLFVDFFVISCFWVNFKRNSWGRTWIIIWMYTTKLTFYSFTPVCTVYLRPSGGRYIE